MARPTAVLLDSNLLLLLVVGLVDPTYIAKARTLSAYSVEDFELLTDILASFRTIVTTPHILTEISNLIGRERDDICREVRGKITEFVSKAQEERAPAVTLVADPAFVRLGITDTAISIAASLPAFVLTADAPLYVHVSGSGGAVANFNHIRVSGWE